MTPRKPPGWLVRQILPHRRLTETLQRWRYRSRWMFHPPLLGVHSKPRTGSVAVVRALRAVLGHRRVLHLHYMNPETIRKNRRSFDTLFEKTGRAGLHAEFLAAEFLSAYRAQHRHERLNLISLVRDPMARTVSAFFKQFTLNHPGMGIEFLCNPDNLDRLRGMFFDSAEPEPAVSLNWFDTEVKDVFGIDVFAEPFPREQGYRIFKGPDCDLLLLRLEDSLRVGPKGVAELLPGIPAITPRHENSTRERERYHDNYLRFARSLRPPASYLDRMYDSRLARHFYTTKEIDSFRNNWL